MGSLIWSPRELPHHGPWAPNGPTIPIEFARIARDGRLSLIIDHDHGEMVPSWSALATATHLEEGRVDLASREGCPIRNIGCTDLNGNETEVTGGVVGAWCRRTGWDGAVWTQLPSTFEERTGDPFSVEAALAYLHHLTGDTR
ncbi:MAG: hypothetical protein GEU79_09035 [Acidimicrobiia bacterium]|nr:hypothetical protein [Acidimicrobiia bacterium]